MFTPIGNQSRCFLQTISITPLYALECIRSALQSRTCLSHSGSPISHLLPAFAPLPPVFIPRAANPAFSAQELQHQLECTGAKLLFVHPSALKAGLAAARAVGLSDDKVVLIEPAPNANQGFITLDEVITEGLQHPKPFTDRKLKPGEAKTKIAVSVKRFRYVTVV